jgi:hypothetical protein
MKMNKLLNLIRERRKYETRTIDGYVPANKLMHHLLSEEIEIEMKTIGGQNKTRLRKEAKGNPYLEAKIKEWLI